MPMKYIQPFSKKVITRSGYIDYLIRWNIIGIGTDSCIFSIKLHKILVSDDACMHDHPWAFLTIILKGGYKEYFVPFKRVEDITTAKWDEKSQQLFLTKFQKPGSILYRPSNWIHKIELDKPAWTLVFTFREKKKWGFFTKKGWLPWYQYSKEKDC